MTGTKEDIAILRAMLADAPTKLLIQEVVRRGFTVSAPGDWQRERVLIACVPSVPFDLGKELVDEQDD